MSVTPWIDSVSPAQFNPGTQNNVTITGGGFGQSPTLGFSPGAGLSYTILSASDSTITLALNVTASASPGSSNVTVSSNGASGQGFLSASGASPQSNPKSIVVNGTGCSYSIPIDGQKFSIGSDYLTASIPLEVTESTHNAACVGKVNWTVVFSYHPSRGFPSSSSGTLSACGMVNAVTTLTTPAGVGGQGSVTATIVIGTARPISVHATVYIDGFTLAQGVAENLLTNLYRQVGGTTVTLMAAIAERESSSQQFHGKGEYAYSPLWNRDGYWPTESSDPTYGNGSHIGLMQLQTTMMEAYNLNQNAIDGVNFFWQKNITEKPKIMRISYGPNVQTCPRLTPTKQKWTL